MNQDTLYKAHKLWETLLQQKEYVRYLEEATENNGLNKGEIIFKCGYDMPIKFNKEQFKHIVELALSLKRSELEKTEKEINLL